MGGSDSRMGEENEMEDRWAEEDADNNNHVFLAWSPTSSSSAEVNRSSRG